MKRAASISAGKNASHTHILSAIPGGCHAHYARERKIGFRSKNIRFDSISLSIGPFFNMPILLYNRNRRDFAAR
jgi:hypothetical protein